MTPPDLPATPAARRGRPPKARAATSVDTRESILDAAEDLFSKHGFYGVTIREVAREAGVDTALIHYYFTAKRGLFEAVFLRRAEVWNNDRVAAINRYAEAPGPGGMTLEGLFEAFLRPPFEWSLKGGPGWKHYAALVAQTNANPAFGGETMARYFDPAIHRLIELIKQVLPQAAEVDIYWAYHNLSGALTLTLGETGRLDRLSGGLCRSGDLESACAYMVRFAAAGFRAVCETSAVKVDHR
ncbi:MAG: TetR/AcrR family transcriptional regulator [Brevundimonas sp.]|uniref:TetR/AcrR family transcriptional regulator n=1 Tax=Brevundimonas sp. TaxID=1871086 RepID=UPI001205C18D|nr:TetR/AcrR family transcriptional regulator [Brevundimonas sp.]RZJ18501.1 MAG: TetR/AcrR family transcriptional regulator [Brevundimonas sp.]